MHRSHDKSSNAADRQSSLTSFTGTTGSTTNLIFEQGHRELQEALREFARSPRITVIEAPVDDIWMRDIAPTFAWRGRGHDQELVAIDWNFNGWGGTNERPPRRGEAAGLLADECDNEARRIVSARDAVVSD
jgi:agmatine/peptidylarginine deiminase